MFTKLYITKFSSFLIIIIFLNFYETFSSPIGKGLSCSSTSNISGNFESFRGIYFESEKSVRVVSFKNKNNSLKVISKQTPYKIFDDKIEFKIKFIWYGEISFEYFKIDRKKLILFHTFKNINQDLKCSLVKEDFMSSMNKIKSDFQNILNEDLKLNRI